MLFVWTVTGAFEIVYQSPTEVVLDGELAVPIYCVCSGHCLEYVYEWTVSGRTVGHDSTVLWVKTPGLYRCREEHNVTHTQSASPRWYPWLELLHMVIEIQMTIKSEVCVFICNYILVLMDLVRRRVVAVLSRRVVVVSTQVVHPFFFLYSNTAYLTLDCITGTTKTPPGGNHASQSGGAMPVVAGEHNCVTWYFNLTRPPPMFTHLLQVEWWCINIGSLRMLLISSVLIRRLAREALVWYTRGSFVMRPLQWRFCQM